MSCSTPVNVLPGRSPIIHSFAPFASAAFASAAAAACGGGVERALSFFRSFGLSEAAEAAPSLPPSPPTVRRRLLSVPLSRLGGIEGERGPGGSACAWNITGDVEENLERVDVKS